MMVELVVNSYVLYPREVMATRIYDNHVYRCACHTLDSNKLVHHVQLPLTTKATLNQDRQE